MLPSTAWPLGFLLRRSDLADCRKQETPMIDIFRVSFDGAAIGNSFTGASTSLSRKSRKRFPDVHAFKLFHFLKSRFRFFNAVIIQEASDDSPRDFQGWLPKEG